MLLPAHEFCVTLFKEHIENDGVIYTVEMQKQRLRWIDIAKAMAILFVVFGHTARAGVLQEFVYSFHVAAFFLLAGMTCNAEDIACRIKRDFMRIMIPYYCFGLISIGIFALLGRFAADRFAMEVDVSVWNNLAELLYACPKGNRMKFNMPLWFLPCLFAVKLMYYALHALWRGKQTGILFSSAVLAAVGFIYVRLVGIPLPFNLSVGLKMLAFFALGRSTFLAWPNISKHISTRKCALFLGVGLLAVAFAVAWFSPKVNYSGDTFPHIPSFLVTALLGGFGTCFAAMAIHRSTVLEYVGKRTLAILLMHKFPVLLFQTVGPLKTVLAQGETLTGTLAALAVSVIAVALCLAAEWVITRYLPFLFGTPRKKEN